VQDFCTCHKLFDIRHIQGIQVQNKHCSNPVKEGALWDRALQYALGNTEVDLQSVIDDYDIDEISVQKIKALYRAYKELGIEVQSGYELQAKIDLKLDFPQGWVWGTGEPIELAVRGFYDRKYPDGFVENKLSGRPDNYLNPFFFSSQIATYFRADPKNEYCIMEVVRNPGLKPSRDEQEDYGLYGDRVYKDVIGRPSYYFIGFEKAKRTYGKKYYRTEFDLEEIRSRYLHIFREIHEASMLGGYYRNDRACNNILPGITCEYIGVCRYGKVSDTVYEMRRKDIE
jgi:hypothetical protein